MGTPHPGVTTRKDCLFGAHFTSVKRTEGHAKNEIRYTQKTQTYFGHTNRKVYEKHRNQG